MNKREQFPKMEKKIVLENVITFTSMIEVSVNEEHSDNNENVTDTILDNTKNGKVTPPDITSLYIMEEC